MYITLILSIFFSIISTSVLLFLPGYFIWSKSHSGLERILLTIISSIAINQYLLLLIGLIVPHASSQTIGTISLSTLWIIFFVYKLRYKSLPVTRPYYQKSSKIILFSLLLITIVVTIIPRVDLVVNRTLRRQPPIIGSSIHDDIKHIAVLNSIKENGVFTVNPFFANEDLKYYIGYYVLPAAVSHTFKLETFPVWLVWTLITNVIWILSIFCILKAFVKKELLAFLITICTFLIGNADIIPAIYFNSLSYIDAWNNSVGGNIQIPTTFSYLIFLPQHIFAITLFLFGSYLAFAKNCLINYKSHFISGIILAFITNNSIYIGIFAAIIFVVFLLCQKLKWSLKLKSIGIILLGLCVFALPLLYFLLGNNGGLQLSYPQLAEIQVSPITQTLLSLTIKLLLDIGWVLPAGIFGLYAYFKARKSSSNLFLDFQIFILVITLLLVHFISSKFFNDWAMKGSLLITLSCFFFTGYYINQKPKRLLAFIPLIVIAAVTFGNSLISFSKPYIRIEQYTLDAIRFADKELLANEIVITDNPKIGSLIPVLTTNPSIVSPLTAESNTVANQTEFIKFNDQVQSLFSVKTESDFNSILDSFDKPYVFLISSTNYNYMRFVQSKRFTQLYDRRGLLLVRLILKT